jgi:hypothetical protein
MRAELEYELSAPLAGDGGSANCQPACAEAGVTIERNPMNDMSHDSSLNAARSSAAGSPTEPVDQAALALKSSVVADAHDLTDEAKHVASDVLAHARKSAEAQISGGKDRVADGLGNVAKAIRHTGEELRSKDEAGLTEYVVRAANQVEAASDYLKEKSLSDVLGDVGGLARREPAMFLGGAFLLGLLGGRFLKSSHVQPTRTYNGPVKIQARPGQRSSGRSGDSRNNSRNNSSTHNSGNTPSARALEPKASSAEKPRDLGGSPSSGGVSYENGRATKPGAM